MLKDIQDFKDVAKLLNMARAVIMEIGAKEKKKSSMYWRLIVKATNGVDGARYAMEAIMKIDDPDADERIFYPEISVKIVEE